MIGQDTVQDVLRKHNAGTVCGGDAKKAVLACPESCLGGCYARFALDRHYHHVFFAVDCLRAFL